MKSLQSNIGLVTPVFFCYQTGFDGAHIIFVNTQKVKNEPPVLKENGFIIRVRASAGEDKTTLHNLLFAIAFASDMYPRLYLSKPVITGTDKY